MNNKILSPIVKILILVTFLVLTIFSTQPTSPLLLAKTSENSQVLGPNNTTKIATVSPKRQDCDGLWIDSDSTQKILLNAINLKNWGANSSPSLILDSPSFATNFLIIGHNICYYGKCDAPRSQFANIMKLNIGDKVSACIKGSLYTGYIFTSGPIPDTRTEVMGDWTGFDTVTMFTSYGTCKDSQCTSTNQRWMVAFQRE